MRQQGQVFELQTMGADGRRLWAYRYRAGGRGSRRVRAAASSRSRPRSKRPFIAHCIERLPE
jgi:hypothetical protein